MPQLRPGCSFPLSAPRSLDRTGPSNSKATRYQGDKRTKNCDPASGSGGCQCGGAGPDCEAFGVLGGVVGVGTLGTCDASRYLYPSTPCSLDSRPHGGCENANAGYVASGQFARDGCVAYTPPGSLWPTGGRCRRATGQPSRGYPGGFCSKKRHAASTVFNTLEQAKQMCLSQRNSHALDSNVPTCHGVFSGIPTVTDGRDQTHPQNSGALLFEDSATVGTSTLGEQMQWLSDMGWVRSTSASSVPQDIQEHGTVHAQRLNRKFEQLFTGTYERTYHMCLHGPARHVFVYIHCF